MTVDTRVFTADDLLRLPDDGFRYELVQGELRKMSPAGLRHGKIAASIAAHLFMYAKQHRLGTVVTADAGFVMSRNPDTVRAPDVAFLQTDRVIDTAGFFPGPPDLAIEVISPSDLYSEVDAKTLEYVRAGTRVVIIVNPDNSTVYVHRPSGSVLVEDVLAVDDVVPGWTLPLAEIFET